MRKPSRKNLIRRLDALVRKIVLERNPYCVLAASSVLQCYKPVTSFPEATMPQGGT